MVKICFAIKPINFKLHTTLLHYNHALDKNCWGSPNQCNVVKFR